MKLILAIVKPFKVTELVDAFAGFPAFPGMTVFTVQGFGREKEELGEREEAREHRDFVEHSAVLVAARDEQTDAIVERLRLTARTGRSGDGKILVLDLEEAVKIITGQRGEAALR
jgi:nitrogen regulatory protein PII